MRVIVLGAGIGGMATSVLLARDGHDVTLVERDEFGTGAALDSPRWERQGVPHFLLPHAFIPRGRYELRAGLPDVYDALVANGARDADLRPKMPPGEPVPGDEHFQYLAVRRPLVEWALRRAVLAEPRVTVRAGVRVDGLVRDGDRVAGVTAGGGDIDGDLVVDALGRRTPTPGWLGEPEGESSDCGVVYYSRYFKVRDGFTLPDGPFLLSPRADLGYLGYATFPGDNGTFSALLAVPPGVPEWRAFREPAVWHAAVARIPGLRAWVDPEGTDPITGVMTMAGLRNALRRWDSAAAPGLVPVGDALVHTDPVLAHGLALSLAHARALAAALRDHAGHTGDAAAAYAAAVAPTARERYDLLTALDEQRLRLWLGEPVRLAPDGDRELFTVAAGGAVAMVDRDVFRAFVRRFGMIHPVAELDGDAALLHRIDETFRRLNATPRPPAGPSRDEMVALVAELS